MKEEPSIGLTDVYYAIGYPVAVVSAIPLLPWWLWTPILFTGVILATGAWISLVQWHKEWKAARNGHKK